VKDDMLRVESSDIQFLLVSCYYTVCSKNIPDIFDCNLKKDY